MAVSEFSVRKVFENAYGIGEEKTFKTRKIAYILLAGFRQERDVCRRHLVFYVAADDPQQSKGHADATKNNILEKSFKRKRFFFLPICNKNVEEKNRYRESHKARGELCEHSDGNGQSDRKDVLVRTRFVPANGKPYSQQLEHKTYSVVVDGAGGHDESRLKCKDQKSKCFTAFRDFKFIQYAFKRKQRDHGIYERDELDRLDEHLCAVCKKAYEAYPNGADYVMNRRMIELIDLARIEGHKTVIFVKIKDVTEVAREHIIVKIYRTDIVLCKVHNGHKNHI